MAALESPRRGEVRALLALSALAGFAMGALRPALQVALEPAQLLAGVVPYPDGNPFGFYQLRVWTLWHQALAPLLAAGVPERALSVAVSGLVGAITFAGVALLARAAGAAPWLAAAAPFLLATASPSGWGFHYPLTLLGQSHTYGTAGLAWLALVLGLLGTGRFFAGALALGLAPSLHASLGAWLALAVGIAAALRARELGPQRRALLAGGALGVLLSVASLAAHLAQAPRLEADAAETARHLDAFVRLWDAHRKPPALASWKGAAVLCEVGIALALLTRARLPAAARLAWTALGLIAALGLGLGALQHAVPAGALPDLLSVAMPTRLLNLPMLAFVPLVVGALWSRRGHLLARATLLGVAVGVFALARAPSLARVVVPLAGILALVEVWRRPPAAEAERAQAGAREGRPAARLARPLDAALALACAAAAALGLVEGVRQLRPRLDYLIDRTNHPVLAAAARGRGLLAVGPGIERVQLRTLRPLLLDPTALDMLPYAPPAAPATARIVGDVYGIDFFDPPAPARHAASLPEHPVRETWESRDTAAWQSLAREFGFTEVLVLARWHLRLPEVARSPEVALYRVPAASDARRR